VVPNERHESARFKNLNLKRTPDSLDETQLLIFGIANRQNQPATFREL
jgi:hypothetical protein